MKKLFFFTVLSIASIFWIYGQSTDPICNLGFAYEISNSPNWGTGEPVITHITPGSPAEKAGLKLNDIILEVNGKGTYRKSHQDINSWLLDNAKSNIQMAIRNLATNFKSITFLKDCHVANSIDEAQLAPLYAFYSLEDVQNRSFTMPIKVKANPKANFTEYKTFDFSPPDAGTPAVDKRVSQILEKMLEKRGLVRDSNNPDFIIQTYYSYQNNPDYAVVTNRKYETTWRYDVASNKMVVVPAFSPTEKVDSHDVAYFLEFGFRFFDRKYFEPGELVQIWQCEVKEKLKSNYGLEKYLEFNLPLLLLKYPYPGNSNFATFEVNSLKYNDTGISMDLNDLSVIVHVDPASPAALAGLQPGDKIKSIDGVKFNDKPKALSRGYRRFIIETMDYRDQSTRYTDTHGYPNCMYWKVEDYHKVAEKLRSRVYKSSFSYLFNFNQYINWNTPSVIVFEIERAGSKIECRVTPEIIRSSHLSVY